MVSTTLPTDLPELVDWQLAARVGRRVAGGEALPARAAWSRQFTELSTTADGAVAEFTGLGGELPPPVAEPLDRGEWVEANLATLRRILRPLAEKVAERKAWKATGPVPAAMRTSTRAIAGAQAGTLLGYVGQRVLGQYDLPMPGPDQTVAADGDAALRSTGAPPWGSPDPSGPVKAHGEGTVWYVVPNIVATERRHRFRPADFRLWIALHETAHRRQFRGVPWLPGHIQGLLDEYLGSVEVDDEALKRLSQRLQGLARRVIAGEKIELLDLLVTPEQKTIVDRVQSTMTVLEGHGEFVMDQLGDRLVPNHQHMHDTLRARRNAPGAAERLIQQLLGFRQKLDQYAMGEKFVRRLFERGGMAAVNQVFAEPAALPTMDEVRDPDRYLARAG
ncbi:MAG TPA: zinc-dependent metalloprotease [Actinomycetes bacterium]|nr:zinc-dependent metalloprotease [Actinomycetes bacterium]